MIIGRVLAPLNYSRTLRAVRRRETPLSDDNSRGKVLNVSWGQLREAVQERVVRQIRMLRAMRRELETALRTRLPRHEGGNPGHEPRRILRVTAPALDPTSRTKVQPDLRTEDVSK